MSPWIRSRSARAQALPEVHFTPNLQRHIDCPSLTVDGANVRTALEAVFARQPALRSYILDDQGGVRQHVAIFVDGRLMQDRKALSDTLQAHSEVFVMQALSGG